MATTTERKTYYIASGEGEIGTWDRVRMTTRGLKQRLSKERCNGDRWARAVEDVYETSDGNWAGRDVETGEIRDAPAPSDF